MNALEPAAYPSSETRSASKESSLTTAGCRCASVDRHCFHCYHFVLSLVRLTRCTVLGSCETYAFAATKKLIHVVTALSNSSGAGMLDDVLEC